MFLALRCPEQLRRRMAVRQKRKQAMDVLSNLTGKGMEPMEDNIIQPNCLFEIMEKNSYTQNES